MAQAAQAVKTETFTFHGKDRRGNATKGELQSESVTLAKAQLRKQGITPQVVRKKAKPLLGGRKKAIPPADIAIFARQPAAMMKAGVPPVQSFGILGQGEGPVPFTPLQLPTR